MAGCSAYGCTEIDSRWLMPSGSPCEQIAHESAALAAELTLLVDAIKIAVKYSKFGLWLALMEASTAT
jgi:hypothetical protein